jgi:tetratricopeptide (TPR) repeat protein
MAVFVASTGRRSPAGLRVAPLIRRKTIDVDTYELFRRGSELLAAGHAHQAVIALERARDAAPGHGSVREALGRAYYGAGRTSAAEAEFAEALEIDPSNDYAHFGLGLCLARGGERVRAVGHLRLAVVMRPEVDSYRQALDRVERQRAAEGTGGARASRDPGPEGPEDPGGGDPALGDPASPSDPALGGPGDPGGRRGGRG